MGVGAHLKVKGGDGASGTEQLGGAPNRYSCTSRFRDNRDGGCR